MPNEGLSDRLSQSGLLYWENGFREARPIKETDLDQSKNYRLSIRKRGGDLSIIYRTVKLEQIEECLKEADTKISLKGASVCLVFRGDKQWH